MMSDACRELRAALGAAALGRADPAEMLALQRPSRRLRRLPGRAARADVGRRGLPLADPSRVTGDRTQPPAALQAQVLDRVAAERTARRTRTRRRIAVAAATATAIAAAVVAFVLVVPDHSPSGTKVVFASNSGVTAARDAAAARRRHRGRVPRLRSRQGRVLLALAHRRRTATGSGPEPFQGTGGPIDAVMTAALPLDQTRGASGSPTSTTRSFSTSCSRRRAA